MNTLKAKISLHYRRIFSSYRVVNLFLGYEKVTDRSMAQPVSTRPLTAESRVRAQAIPAHVKFVAK